MPPRRKKISTDGVTDDEGEDNFNMVKKFGIIFLLRRYAEVSAISGIPQLQRSKEVLRMILWTTIVLAGAGVLIWQMALAISNFLSYNTNTIISRTTNVSIGFPAVTICNENPINFLKINAINATIYNMLLSYQAPNPGANGSVQAPQLSSAGPSGIPNINGISGRNTDLYFQQNLMIQTLMATLTKSQQIASGTDLNNMLINCYFNNYVCTVSDFTAFYNYQYGNCFTFNLMNNKSGLQTLEIGPQYGLKLTLFINGSTYIPTTINSGVRVLVHHPTEYPFPEDLGIEVSPGKLNSIGLTLTVSNAIGPPYGKCQQWNLTESMGLSLYTGLMPNITYSKEGCLKTCRQIQIIQNCSCYHPYIPFSASMLAFQNISTANIRMCNVTLNNPDYLCSENVKVNIINNSSLCSNCTTPCKKYSFIPTVSQCNWPSDSAQQSIINLVNSMSAMATLQQQKGITPASLISNQLLALEVYYDSMTYIEMTDQPAYLIYNLISDIGGQMGLWLGLSISAFFEVFELLYDTAVVLFQLILLRCRENKKKKKNKTLSKVAWEKF